MLHKKVLEFHWCQGSLKKTFIGPLTRFKKTESERKKYKYKYLAIISGPEPQRSLLEDEIQNCFAKTKEHCAIINGLTKTKETSTGKITFVETQGREDLYDVSFNNNITIRSIQPSENRVELNSDVNWGIMKEGLLLFDKNGKRLK